MASNHQEKEKTLQIIKLLKEEKFDELNAAFSTMRPYDMAAIYQSLPERHRAAMLHHLDISALASMIKKLKKVHQLELLSKVGPDKANRILSLLNVDFLPSLLRHFPKTDLEMYLSEMEEGEANYVKKILEYPENLAGSIMSNHYVSVQASQTVTEAVEKVKALAPYSESINHLYVVTPEGKLLGSVSYRDLIIAEPDEIVKNLVVDQIIAVKPGTKRSEIARLLQRYDFTSLPVVNNDDVLIGMVTFDDMVSTVISEAAEDISKISATSKEIDFDTKPLSAALKRLPWLIALLFIGLVSGSIISKFEATLEQVVALAFFMPLIAGMTGNTGTQSLAVVIRGLAERDIDAKTVIKLVFREFRASLWIGLTCGILIALIAYIWQGNIYLGIVVGGSLICTLIIGTLAGTVIPLILYKFKLDPAVASGPLITTINDIFSLITYFSVASYFITKLV